MAWSNAQNSLNVLIGKTLSPNTSLQVVDKLGANYLADGEIAVLGIKDNGVEEILPDTNNTSKEYPAIRIVQRSGAVASESRLVSSLIIRKGTVKKYLGKGYDSANLVQDMKVAVGFDGTSGNIEALSNNEYVLRLVFKHDKHIWSEQKFSRIYRHVTGTSSTQESIAQDIVKKIAHDSSIKDAIGVEQMVNLVFTNVVGITATVSNGSPIVTFSAAPSFSVGDYVRFTGNAVTLPAYKVKSISGNDAELTIPYQGTSGSGIAYSQETLANVQASDNGIVLSGKLLPFEVGKFEYKRSIFDVLLSGFGTTTYNPTLQKLVMGNGEWQIVAEQEWQSLHFDGYGNRISYPLFPGKQDVVQGVNYDTIIIESLPGQGEGSIVPSPASPNLLYIFVEDGSPQTNTGVQGSFLKRLNDWMVSEGFNSVSV